MLEFLIWFVFGDLIIGAFAILLIWLTFKVIGMIFGAQIADIANVFHFAFQAFWPAFLIGGIEAGIRKKSGVVYKWIVIWAVVVLIYTHTPGQIKLPNPDDVAKVTCSYIKEEPAPLGQTTNRRITFSTKDPQWIRDLTNNITTSDFKHSYEALIERGYYFDVTVTFLDADGNALKVLRSKGNQGLCVDGPLFFDFYYKATEDSTYNFDYISKVIDWRYG